MIQFFQKKFILILITPFVLFQITACSSKQKKENTESKSSTTAGSNQHSVHSDAPLTPEEKEKRVDDQNKKYKELSTAMVTKDDLAVEKIVSQLLSYNMNDVKVLNALGLYHAGRGRFSLSEMILNNALKVNEKSDVVYNSLAWVALQKGEKRKAIQYYKKSLEINPDYTPSLISLGSFFAEAKDYGNARYLLETAYRKGSPSMALINNYAVTLMGLGESADDIFEAGLKLNSTSTGNLDFLTNYGVYLVKVKKNYSKGKEILNKINFIGVNSDRRQLILELEQIINSNPTAKESIKR